MANELVKAPLEGELLQETPNVAKAYMDGVLEIRRAMKQEFKDKLNAVEGEVIRPVTVVGCDPGIDSCAVAIVTLEGELVEKGVIVEIIRDMGLLTPDGDIDIIALSNRAELKRRRDDNVIEGESVRVEPKQLRNV